MTKEEKSSWLNSIGYCADHITEEIGYDTVKFVLEKYGATSINDLNPSDYSEVYDELSAIEADLR